MTRSPAVFAACALLAIPSVSAATGGKVLTVDRSGAGDYLSIQSAVDAATQQDAILVKSGGYEGFSIVGKSLSIASDVGPPSEIHGPVVVESLPDGRDVSFSSFHFRQGFEVRDCEASVLFVDCEFREPGFGNDFQRTNGLHQVWSCKDVTFANCNLIGRDGGSYEFETNGYDGAFGEPGLLIVDSTATLYSCKVRGGAGGYSQDGQSIGCIAAYQGDGGDGLRGFGSFIYLGDTSPVGGPRGDHQASCSTQHNQDGEDLELDPTSTLAVANHPPLHFDSSSVVRENETLSVTLEGTEGARAWLLWSVDPEWRHLGVTIGNLHLQSSSLNFMFLGTIPGGGVLQTDLTLPSIPAGDDFLRLYMEPFALDGGRILGDVRRVLVLDPKF